MRIRILLFTLLRVRILLLIEVICGSAITGLQTLFLSLQNASIVSVHGPPRLHFMPLKLLDFDLNADPEPTFHSNLDTDPDFQR